MSTTTTTTEGVMDDMMGLDNVRSQKTEQWEINGMGQFLLKLQDTNVIYFMNDALIMDRSIMRQEFDNFMKATNNVALKTKFEKKLGENINIGKLLYDTNFLIKTPSGSNFYRINHTALNKYREQKWYEIDLLQKNGCRIPRNDNNDSICIEKLAYRAPKIDTSIESQVLQYQGSLTKWHDINFDLSSMGCAICQQNFDQIQEYEEHAEYHGDESDFKSLEKMDKLSSPLLKVSYQLCVESHLFAFTIEALTVHNLIIDGIIIVKSRSFHYVDHMRMPYKMPSNGKYLFFVDSHLFKISLEQPLVVVFRQQQLLTNITADRQFNVEQHHFMRTAPFPSVYFGISPYRLSSSIPFKQKGRLQSYMPTNKFIKALNSNCDRNNLLIEHSESFRKYFEKNKCFTLQNIQGAMTTMLRIEDVETLNIYHKMTRTNVNLRQFAKEISIKLNDNTFGFNETILSPGDEVIMIAEEKNNQELSLTNEDVFNVILKSNAEITRKSKRDNQQIYFGWVELVMNNRATVKCERKLPEKRTFTIIFRPGRFVLRQQYYALCKLEMLSQSVLKRFLFPVIDRTLNPLAELYNLELNDPSIYGNPEQLNAVKQIAKSNSLPTPFILYGPPGTGKTATVVESIMQLLVHRSDTRILVMAGSNGACDEISVRLLRLIAKTHLNNTKTLTRIFSRSSDKRIDNIDENLLEHSNMYSTHFYPHVSIIHEYRIIICTLSIAGKLSMGGFGVSCENREPVFTHIFVDEAAASTETETLMGITCAMSPRATLIMSGDHKQLGAVLQSKHAENLGFGISLMERLLKLECYQTDENGEYNHQIQSRLRRNYRSHPEIVKLYSELYYDGQLIALASKDEVNLSEKWYKTPNTKFPIIFHAEFGTSLKGINSVSLYNQREINAVMSYVTDFMYFGINGKRLNERDIGIISPYKNQYTRIQEQLNMRNWHHIECGSVETFQGKEKQIIIVSFVRSFSETLGFLDNPRRLNVTLSRPKSLLILIGNPRTLSLNNDFKRIIDICKREGSFVGAPLYEDENTLAMAFNGMVICKKSMKKSRKRSRGWMWRRFRKAKTMDIKTTTTVTDDNKSSDKKTTDVDALAQSTKTYTKQSTNETMDPDDFAKFFESLPRVPESIYFDIDKHNNGTIDAKSDLLLAKNISKTNITSSPASIDSMTTTNKVKSTDVVPLSNKDSSIAKLSALSGNIISKIANHGIMKTAVIHPLKQTYVKLDNEPLEAEISALPVSIDSEKTENGYMSTIAATNQLTNDAIISKMSPSKAILTSSLVNLNSKTEKNECPALPPKKASSETKLSASPANVDNKTMNLTKGILTSSLINFDSKTERNESPPLPPKKASSKTKLSASPANVDSKIMNPSEEILTSSLANVDSKTELNKCPPLPPKNASSHAKVSALLANVDNETMNPILTLSLVNVDSKTEMHEHPPLPPKKASSKAKVSASPVNVANKTAENGIMNTVATHPLHPTSVPFNKEPSIGTLSEWLAIIDSKTTQNGITSPIEKVSSSSVVNVESKTIMNRAIAIVPNTDSLSSSSALSNVNKTVINGHINTADTNPFTITAVMSRIETTKATLTSPVNIHSKMYDNEIIYTCTTNPLTSVFDLYVDNKSTKNRFPNIPSTYPLTNTDIKSRMNPSKAILTTSLVNVDSKTVMNDFLALPHKKAPSNANVSVLHAKVDDKTAKHEIMNIGGINREYYSSSFVDANIEKNRNMNMDAPNLLTTTADLSTIEPSEAIRTSSPLNVNSKTPMNTVVAIESNKETPSNTILTSSRANVAHNNVSPFIASTNVIEHSDVVIMSYNSTVRRDEYSYENLDLPLISNEKSRKSCVIQ